MAGNLCRDGRFAPLAWDAARMLPACSCCARNACCWQRPSRLPVDLAALRERHCIRAERLERDGRRLVADLGWP